MANYHIKLFAHGVPKGQSIWGNPKTNAERHYIENFYGHSSSVPVPTQMLIEVMRMEGETNCYYTYLESGNLQDIDRRTGGYFALTLKINYYYADIQNIYHLMAAAFDKYIVGTILEQTPNGYRFLCSSLEEAERTLKELEGELERYLMSFSTNRDFIPLTGFNTISQGKCGTVNLQDASPKTVLDQVKSTGKISISSLYPSTKERELRNEVDANTQRTISAIRQQAESEIAKAKRQAETDKEKALREKEASLQAAQEKLRNAQEQQERYEKNLRSLEKANRALSEIEQSLSHYGISLQEDSPSKREPSKCGKPNKHPSSGNNTANKRLAKSPLPLFNLILTVLVLIILIIPKSCTNDKADNLDAIPSTQSMTNENEEPSKEPEIEEPVTEEFPTQQEDENTQPSPKEEPIREIDLQELFDEAKIDIKGISPNNPMKVGRSYKIALLHADNDIKGRWFSNDFVIKKNDSIVPKHAGRCVIRYVVNNHVVKERIVEVNK